MLKNFMHARHYIYVTAGHQGIQAAWHICNIRPLKVNTVYAYTLHSTHASQGKSYSISHLSKCFLIVCILFSLLIYTLQTHRFITRTFIICSHNTDNVLYELYVSALNQVSNFSYVLAVAPWWWFPCKLKHVGAASLILKFFNNSTFLNVVCISWTIKCWI